MKTTNPIAKLSRVALGLALLAVWGPARADRGQSLVPGRMGFNALPAIPNADPAIPDRNELELAGATAFSGGYRDGTGAPYFRLLMPFRDIAAVEMDGMPFEVWRTSDATQARNGADKGHGVSPGDLRFGGRFLLHEEDERFPAIGLRIVVKSTTGKDESSKRFTNSPAYAIEGLVGRDLIDGPWRLRAYAKLGFLAWQMGDSRQDDAVDYGVTLRASRADGRAVELEWRGYAGWRGQDRPSVLETAAETPLLRFVSVRASFARGLTDDAPPYEARLGLVFRFSLLPVNHGAPQPANAVPEQEHLDAAQGGAGGSSGTARAEAAGGDGEAAARASSPPSVRWLSTLRSDERDD